MYLEHIFYQGQKKIIFEGKELKWPSTYRLYLHTRNIQISGPLSTDKMPPEPLQLDRNQHLRIFLITRGHNKQLSSIMVKCILTKCKPQLKIAHICLQSGNDNFC